MPQKESTYNEAQIAERLGVVRVVFEDGWIRRVYKTDGWPTTLMLVNAIGYLAEAGAHSPGPHGHVGAGDGEADDAQRRRNYGQGFRARPQDRGRRPLAAARGGALEGTPNKFVRSGDPR